MRTATAQTYEAFARAGISKIRERGRALDGYTRKVRRIAGLLALGALIVQVAPALAQPSDNSERNQSAHVAVARGEHLFLAGDYDAALSEFTAAYESLAGDARQYVLLNNIAVCHERMFRYDQALEFYERYLSEGGERAEDRREVEAVLRTLRALLATLHIESNVRADVWIDNRRVGHAPGPVLVPAGKHLIELRAPVYDSVRKEVLVPAGGTQRVHFELPRLSQYAGLQPTYFWIGAGLTLVATGAAAFFGLSALEADCQGREREKQSPFLNTVEDENHVQHVAQAANVAFVTAGVLAASSVVLLFLTDWNGAERGAARESTQHGVRMTEGFRFAVDATPRSCALLLRVGLP